MKPADTDVRFEGNMEGQTVKMEIVDDEVARAFVMKALQNLYSDTELAVIRELATNARDAHVDAGKSHLPIEVSLPRSSYGDIPDPYLRIRDYGYGLSVDDITNMFSKYGASTKRDTNEQVGSLGFGSKSPLAYTDQFNITSVCNGVKILVLVSKDEGGGNMKIVDTQASDEPSGVMVEIPVARWNNFQNKANRLFSYWPEGTVLVNGKQPVTVQGHKLSDDLMIVNEGMNYVVMGGVPYPIDHDRIDLGLNDGYGIVAQVAIGDVEFPPSREALRYTRVTLERLAQVVTDFDAAVTNVVQDAVDKCAKRPEVITTIRDWNKILPESKGTITYKGETVPHVYEVPDAATDPTQRATTSQYQSAHKLSANTRRERLDVSWWVSSLFVTGYDRDTFTPPTKKKLEKYVDDKGISVDNFVLLRKKPKRSMLKWLDPKLVVDFEKTIVPIKLPRRSRRGDTIGDRIPGSYDMYIDGKLQIGVEAHTVDQNNPVFYQYTRSGAAAYYADPLTAAYPKNTIVTIHVNREAKFRRNFPTAVSCYDAVQVLFKKACANLTEDQKIAIKIRDRKRNLMALDIERLDDPALCRVIRIAQGDSIQPYTNLCRAAGFSIDNPAVRTEFVNPLDKYSLFSEYVLRTNPDHIYFYLNAVYAYLQKSSK